MLYDSRKGHIPIVSETTMRKMMTPPKEKYDHKKALKRAKRRLRKEGFFII